LTVAAEAGDQTLPVTRIGDSAFDAGMPWRAGKPPLREVHIPRSVTSISRNAFAGNALNALVFDPAAALEVIGEGAFQSNSLEGITIPASVIRIEANAFLDNRLGILAVPERVERIGAAAFAKNRLSAIALGGQVKTIGASAFFDNQIREIYHSAPGGAPVPSFPPDLRLLPGFPGSIADEEGSLGEYVKGIGNYAFARNRLSRAVIPPGAARVGAAAFASNALTAVEFHANVTEIGGAAFEDNLLAAVEIPEKTGSADGAGGIGSRAFANNPIASLTFRDGEPLSIGGSAFYNHRLAVLELPSRVTGIGDYAFACDRAADSLLTALTLNEGLVYIGSFAFANNRLLDLTIPNTVQTTGYGAFINNQIGTLRFSPGGTRGAVIEDAAFARNRISAGEASPLLIPERFAAVAWPAFGSNPLLKHLKIEINSDNSAGSGGNAIGKNAFTDYTLEKIDIGDSIIRIEADAFNVAAKTIKAVIIRGGNVTVEADAFAEHPIQEITVTGSIVIGSGTSFGMYGEGFKLVYDGQSGGPGVYTLADSDPSLVWNKQ
jgi:hypothetical protein